VILKSKITFLLKSDFVFKHLLHFVFTGPVEIHECSR